MKRLGNSEPFLILNHPKQSNDAYLSVVLFQYQKYNPTPMKTIILSLLFLFNNNCDPEVKKMAEENIEASVDNKTILSTQPSINPSQITLKIKVMEVYNSGKNICDLSIANVMKMKVQEIFERGSSIVNSPNKNDTILMNFLLPPKDLGIDTLIEAKAIESLCKDASKTYFTIISYKIAE